MDELPISAEEVRLVALEEGLRSALDLDKLRLQMLNEAVDWICNITDLPIIEVRREIAMEKGGQVARNLATINAVKSLVKSDTRTK